MKNFPIAFNKILIALFLSLFFLNVKAAAATKYTLPNHDLKGPDTLKNKPRDDDKIDNDKDKDEDHPEDGVDEDVLERQRQEVKRTKDPALKYVPVERLIEARIRRDQLLAAPHANIINANGTSNTISNLQWTERGPSNVGGRTRALMFDLGDKSHGYKKVWAGGVGGGLWYTTDITASTVKWNKVNDFFDNIAISCIAQNPVNPLEIYVGTGEGWDNADAIEGLGVWKTTNGGTTWTRLVNTSTFNYVNSVLVDKNGSVYIAGLGFGVEQSTDKGSTWTQVLGSPVLGAGNSGADLQLASNGDVYASLGTIFTPGQIFISDFTVNAAKTGNAGTWTNITPSTTGVITASSTNWWRIKLGCAPSAPGTIYAMFEGANSYNMTSFQQYNKTTNTWKVEKVPPGSSFSNSQAWYSLAIAVDPNDPNTVCIGSLDGVKSANGGSTWTPLTQWYVGEVNGLAASQYVHADHHAYVYAPGSSGRIVMGTDGGIAYSDTVNAKGSTVPAFVIKDNTYNVTQFYSVALHPTDHNYFLAGAQDNGSQQFTSTGINNTTEVTGGDGADCFIDQLNGNIQITSYVDNNYYISTDNGANFTAMGGKNGYFINPSDYDSKKENLYTGSTAGTYFRFLNVTTVISPDTGTIKVQGFNKGNVTTVTVSPVTANRVYFGLDNGTVAVVDNANTGTSNSSIVLKPNPSTGGSVSCVAIDSTNESHILITYFNYGLNTIYETQNAFAATPTWTNVDGNLPDMPVRWGMFYPGDPHRAIIATELGVWTTDSLNAASTNWLPTNSGLANVEVDMLKFRPSDRTLAAATHGRGLFTTILPAAPAQPQTITFAKPPAVTYGVADFAPVATSSNGSIPITYKSSDTTIASITASEQIHVKKAGSVTITAMQAANKAYLAATPVPQTLTINKAPLTVTPGTQYEISGFAIPTLPVSYIGFVNGDTPSSIAVAPTTSTTATSSSPAGNYTITASGGSAANYTLSYTTGTLTLEPESDVTKPIAAKTYGDADFNLFGVGTPGVTYTSANPAIATTVGGKIHITGAGTVSINVSNGVNQINKTLTINKAPLNAAANSITGISTYPIPAFTVSYTGFVYSDTKSSVGTTPATSTTATRSSPPGNYPISISGGSSANYTLSYTPGTLTLAPSSYYTYAIPVKTYGDADFYAFGQNPPGLTYTSDNLTVATIVAGKIHIVGAGAVTITVSNGSNSLTKPLTVNPAPLTITANDQSKLTGTSNPTLTISYSGFVNGDTQGSLTTLPTISTTATNSSPAGNYPIIASGAVAANYSITYVAGTLTVTPAIAPNISYITPQTFIINQAINALQPFNSGGAVPPGIYEQVSTLAGSGLTGATNGLGAAASFNGVSGIAVDPAKGNIFVADTYNNMIREVTAGGLVSTFAGSGAQGSTNGKGTNASFYNPGSAAVDTAGNVYVVDDNNLLIRKITPAGVVSTFAGNNVRGISFSLPTDVAVDESGNVFVSDAGFGAIYKIPQSAAFSAVEFGLDEPFGVAVDKSGNVYASDASNRIFKISGGVETLLAGSGNAAFADGTGAAASFNNPNCLKVDAVGNVYVDDSSNNRIRKVTPAGVVTTIAGNNTTASTNGIGTAASLSFPYGSGFDADGNLFISQSTTNLISKIALTGYTIKPALPAGLVFDGTTGIISGTPTAASPSTNYTVTAYNMLGSSSTVINITISTADAALLLLKEPIVHTALSPNGDGIDDIFTIDNIANYPDNKLVLINGSGTKIFEATGYDNVNKPFDGHSGMSKELQPAGTYFYMLQYNDKGITKTKSGYFVIKY